VATVIGIHYIYQMRWGMHTNICQKIRGKGNTSEN
jgi:hypothetical protein